MSSAPRTSVGGTGSRAAAAIALLCAPVLVGGLLALGGHGWERVLLCVICTAAVVPTALAWVFARPFDLFHPMAFVSLSVLMGTTLRALYIVLFDTPHAAWLLDYRPVEELLPGAMVLCAATTCIGLGYWLCGARRFRVERISFLPARWSFPRLRVLFFLVACVSLVAAADFLRRTGFQLESFGDISAKRRVLVNEATRDFASLGYHRWAAQALVVPCFYMFLILWLTQREVRARGYAFLAGACALAFPFLVSARFQLGLVIIVALVAVSLLRRLRYGRMAVVTLVLLFVFGAIRAMREGSLRYASDLPDVVTSGRMFEDVVVNRNFADVSKVSRIYTDTPEQMPREYGRTFLLWTVAWIPRTLWTDKPEINLGDRVIREIYHVSGGGYPPGLVGELIINFGLLGALVGAAVFGWMLRVFYNSFRPVLRTNPTLLLIYLCLVVEISFVPMGTQVARVLMTLMKSFITVGTFLWFVREKRPRSALPLRAARAA